MAVTGHHARLGTRLRAKLCRGHRFRRLNSTNFQGTTLIEPDRRISRIRLSEKGSRFRPRKAACPSSKLDQAQHLMQGGNGELLRCLPWQLMLGTQPLSQPLASMSFDRSIGFADWSKTEIISPPNHHTIECLYHGFLVQEGLVPSGLLADRLTDALHPFLRRRRSQIGPSLRRVTAPERIP